ISKKVEKSEQELDATGCIVTPGFFDPHTHLDAQLCWDPTASPSNLHGVTSVVMGLCGFGIAPCQDDGGEYLLKSLQEVEEIPYASTAAGVDFQWSSWGEFAAHIERQALSINVAGFVPHTALRYAVMGERARGEEATAEDIAAMRAQLAEGLAAGAVGFSTSRGPNHKDAYGDPVPSRFATDNELAQLVSECKNRLWQINVKTKFSGDADALISEVEAYEAWTRAAGANFTWTPFHAEPGNNVWRDVLAHTQQVNADGLIVKPQIAAQPITTSFRFDGFSYIMAVPDWRDIFQGFHKLSAEERKALFADASVREIMARPPQNPDAQFAPKLEDWIVLDSPNHPEAVGNSLVWLGERWNIPAGQAMCDLILGDDLMTSIQVPAVNRSGEAIAVFLNDHDTLIGLGDAGAHVNSINNYAYTTQILQDFVKGNGTLTLPKAIQRMTSEPAQLHGLPARGRLLAGAPADVNVIDLDQLSLNRLETRHDLPTGASRIWQSANGYRYVMVNGEVSIESDKPTGASAGALLRVGA
ncbi:MAG: amidohydrolase family protein, partial [Pseudomonadota bacterium]